MPIKTVQTYYYPYYQNNLNGVFRGAAMIVIEAIDKHHADAIAENRTEIRFNDGCSCCGNRWRRSVYGDNTVIDAIQEGKSLLAHNGISPYILHLDGSRETIIPEMFEIEYWEE